MLLFAHVGLALASSRFWKGAAVGFLALGSMLPDIIDKPAGLIFFGTPAIGRTFAHTLLFLFILLWLAYSMRSIALVSISLGVFIHLALDSMWSTPVVLFWPAFGNFPLASDLDTLSYIGYLLSELHNPVVLLPEIIGLFYIVYTASIWLPEISKKSRNVLKVINPHRIFMK
jgi:membrane-bound metal-dependent hydrolase YbcI (DUF457 family)